MNKILMIIIFIIIFVFIAFFLSLSPHGGFRYQYYWPFRPAKNQYSHLTLEPLSKEQMQELIKGRDELGWPPLSRAAAQGNLGLVKELIEKGVDPNATDGSGKTAVSWASLAGYTEVVAYLRSKGGLLGSELEEQKRSKQDK